jgi:23S rRNA G2069 N7-methylase RlmK/C1962 C5-methylase RlmI
MESMFKNRLNKNFQNLIKWAKRENITAFRIYEKDIPQYPFTLDYYDGSFVIYFFEPTKYPESLEKSDNLKLNEVVETIKELFQTPENDIFIKRRKKQKGVAQYEKISQHNATKIIFEGDLKFIVNLSDYLDCGLFLDHRKTRQFIKNKISNKSLLNLFSYTGSISVAAGMGNAKLITTVDMSNTYLNWAKENFKVNNIPIHSHEFIRADIMQIIPEMTQRQQKYDFIFLDPPSFSNSKKMKTIFDIQKDYIFLINSCEKLLNDNGCILFSNNLKTFKFDKDAFTKSFYIEDFTKKTIPLDFRNQKIHHAWLLKKRTQL